MSQKQKIIVVTIFLSVFSTISSVSAAGASTDFSIPADSISTGLTGGSSTDFSVSGGLTTVPVGGGSTNFAVEPMIGNSSSLSSSSSSSSVSSSTSSVTTSTISTISRNTGGGSRHGFTPPGLTKTTESISSVTATAVSESSTSLPTRRAAPTSSAGTVQVADGQEESSSPDKKSTTKINPVKKVSNTNVVTFKPSTKIDQIRTFAENPFIAIPVETDDSFSFQLFDKNGNLLHMNHVQSEQGILAHRITFDMKPGSYYIVVKNQHNVLVVSKSLLIAETTLRPLEVDVGKRAADENAESLQGSQDLGTLIRGVEDVITGRATPNVRIVGYFRSELLVSETMSDSVGLFRLPVPAGLEDGPHTVTLVQYSSGDREYSETQFRFTRIEVQKLHNAPMTYTLLAMFFLLTLAQIFALLLGFSLLTLHRHSQKFHHYFSLFL